MPFDLKIHYVPINNESRGWSMFAPGWLNPDKPPFDKACIREFEHNRGYRDRYAPISAEELRAWHNETWRNRDPAQLNEHERPRYEQLAAHLKTAGTNCMYLLHWEEWESGLD